MCDVIGIAAAGVAVAAGGAVASYTQQQSAMKQQKSYNAKVEGQQLDYRTQVMQYQNEVWDQDISYANDMLSWSEQEWNRQERYAARAMQAIEKNTIAATGQLLLRQVEEDMATILQGQDQRRNGQVARASIANKAGDRGVDGNSVDAIINDVSRQEGEVLNVMAMNRAASTRAINRQVVEADAQGDQQLSSIQLKTYAPSVQIRSPAPVSPVNPAAPVAAPNVGQLVTGLSGAVTGGIANYSAMSGQTQADTYSQMGNWISRQFTVTPASGGS
jgi:hypothetical protein